MAEMPRRWYLTPAGRVARGLLAVPLAAAAAWLFVNGGAVAVAGGVLLGYAAIMLPWAAVAQEPE